MVEYTSAPCSSYVCSPAHACLQVSMSVDLKALCMGKAAPVVLPSNAPLLPAAAFDEVRPSPSLGLTMLLQCVLSQADAHDVRSAASVHRLDRLSMSGCTCLVLLDDVEAVAEAHAVLAVAGMLQLMQMTCRCQASDSHLRCMQVCSVDGGEGPTLDGLLQSLTPLSSLRKPPWTPILHLHQAPVLERLQPAPAHRASLDLQTEYPQQAWETRPAFTPNDHPSDADGSSKVRAKPCVSTWTWAGMPLLLDMALHTCGWMLQATVAPCSDALVTHCMH